MKKISIVIFCFIVSISGCKRAGDVLATYKDGKITRGDFYDWMDIRNMPRAANLKSKSQQKSLLEQMVIQKIVVRDAKKAGFDKREDYQFISNLFMQNFYSQYLSKTMSEGNDYEEKAARVKIIKLMVKNYKIENNRRLNLSRNELESAYGEKIEAAKSVIKELEKGASFEELAKKYSEDVSKQNGGDIGFVIEGLRSEAFTRAVFSLKNGEITREPLRIDNAVFIIKIDDVVTLTGKNIERHIKDKNDQTTFKRRFSYNAMNKLQEKLVKAPDVENNIEKVNFANPVAVIYKFGGKEFRVSDIDKLISYIVARKKKMGIQDKGPGNEEKKRMAKDLLMRNALMREAVARGLDKEEKFKKELQMTLDYYLFGMYHSEIMESDIKVTPQEVQDYYKKNLDKMFTRNQKEGNKMVKKTVPFETVRKSIEYRLINMKRSEKAKAWASDLLNKSNFKINESELEGK